MGRLAQTLGPTKSKLTVRPRFLSNTGARTTTQFPVLALHNAIPILFNVTVLENQLANRANSVPGVA